MYIYTFLLRIASTITSQNIEISSWALVAYAVFSSQPACDRAPLIYKRQKLVQALFTTDERFASGGGGLHTLPG
jgi:hypothetical protein